MDNQMPKISLNDTQLPEIKDWEVGKEYEVCIKVKMVSKRQGSEWSMPNEKTDKAINATFDVIEAEVDTPDSTDTCDCMSCGGDKKGCGCCMGCNCGSCGSEMQTYEAEYAGNMSNASKK